MNKKQAEQKTYVKPELTAVKLVAEEAVLLATCKTGSGGFQLCRDNGDTDCGGDQQSS